MENYTDAILQTGPTYIQIPPSKELNFGITIAAEPIDVTGKIGSYVNFSASVQANNPKFQWFNKFGAPMPRMCQSNLTIGPIKEEDFGFFRLEIKSGSLISLTRWVELKKSQPRIIQSDSPRTVTESQTRPFPSPPIESKLKLLQAPIGGTFLPGSIINLVAHFQNAEFYQWYKDGEILEGCTWNSLTINHANPGNTGYYTIYAANKESRSHADVKINVNY